MGAIVQKLQDFSDILEIFVRIPRLYWTIFVGLLNFVMQYVGHKHNLFQVEPTLRYPCYVTSISYHNRRPFPMIMPGTNIHMS